MVANSLPHYARYLQNTGDVRANSRLRSRVHKTQMSILNSHLEKPIRRQYLLDELPEPAKTLAIVTSYTYTQTKRRNPNPSAISSKESDMKLEEKLKQHIASQKKSQNQIAKNIDISSGAISTWLSGTYKGDNEKLHHYIEIYLK